MAKKRKLTALEKKNIIAIITVGCSRETAARYVGCSPYIIRREIAENKSFAADVARAEEDSEVFFINKIRQAANKEQYWRAAAWALERRCPNRYAPRGAGSLNTDQVRAMVSRLAEIVIQEVPGGTERRRILKRIHDMIRQAEPEMETMPEDDLLLENV